MKNVYSFCILILLLVSCEKDNLGTKQDQSLKEIEKVGIKDGRLFFASLEDFTKEYGIKNKTCV